MVRCSRRSGRAENGISDRQDRTAASLRIWARRTPDPRAALRAYAIADALEGMSRAEAARLAGMERQALRDAVGRADGIDGLSDRSRPKPSRLTGRP